MKNCLECKGKGKIHRNQSWISGGGRLVDCNECYGSGESRTYERNVSDLNDILSSGHSKSNKASRLLKLIDSGDFREIKHILMGVSG